MSGPVDTPEMNNAQGAPLVIWGWASLGLRRSRLGFVSGLATRSMTGEITQALERAQGWVVTA